MFIATSLDGFIARADGGIDWLPPPVPGDDFGFGAFMATVDALVMGRKTYETALGFGDWPYVGTRVIVLGHGAPVSRHGEEHTAEPPAALVARLGGQGVRRIYVDGGATIRSFLAADLIDDVTLTLIPVVLGAGIPLFAGGTEHRFALEDSRVHPSGMVQLRYRVRR